MYYLTQKRLLYDLYYAFFCAREAKSKADYVVSFERNLHHNLIELRDELWERRYVAKPSSCFIINHPKKREVFAADFRDRIVHHLYYNYTNTLYDNTFIEDSYSCRIGKGTHYGINRFVHHIRSESKNYTRKTYVLKMDIVGYFMHIDRNILLDCAMSTLRKMRNHKVSKHSEVTWGEKIDYDFVEYLTKELILLDPTINCVFKSPRWQWHDLDKSKSLFNSKVNHGMPIGNLTSQLLSNVYLNVLDQFIKRELKCKHYGRYVDDFFMVSCNKEFLQNLIPQIENFLIKELHLSIHKGKSKIHNVNYGVEFLGAFAKPHRTYISNGTLRRIKKRLYDIEHGKTEQDVCCSLNSLIGVFSHYTSKRIKCKLLSKMKNVTIYGNFNYDYSKFVKIEVF